MQALVKTSGQGVAGEMKDQQITTANTIRKHKMLVWGPERLPNSTAIWVSNQNFSTIYLPLDSATLHRFFFFSLRNVFQISSTSASCQWYKYHKNSLSQKCSGKQFRCWLRL